MSLSGISGCGLGLRREFLHNVTRSNELPDWFEITPENWLQMPYAYQEDFYKISSQFDLVAHGVALSLGSPDPLDFNFLRNLKRFFSENGIHHYSEHLSFSSWNGHQAYELLPIPMTIKMADFISDKIKQVSDYLGMPLIVENVSYYYIPLAEISEVDFINRVLQKTGCPLLLDVNNVYVNSVNHKFNAIEFIENLDLSNVAYIHTAGHTYFKEDDLIIDTHGASVSQDVWSLLNFTLQRKIAPVMIERDNNIPAWSDILKEYSQLKNLAYSYYYPGNRQRQIG